MKANHRICLWSLEQNGASTVDTAAGALHGLCSPDALVTVTNTDIVMINASFTMEMWQTDRYIYKSGLKNYIEN